LEIESPRGQGTKLRVRLPLLVSDFRGSSAADLQKSLAADGRANSPVASPEVGSSRQAAATDAGSRVVSAVGSPKATAGVELEALSPVVRS
jgi:hypothetical protein